MPAQICGGVEAGEDSGLTRRALRQPRHAHGCVKADFSVKADIPADLRRGVFAATRFFTAWIRFSNGDGKPQNDHTRDGRGMAIKLTGVDGPKLLAEEAEAKPKPRKKASAMRCTSGARAARHFCWCW